MPALIPVPDDGLLKMSDVLRLLNISRTALFNLRRRGLLPSVHVGRALRFRRQDVERYIRRHTRRKL
jgi:excisionase family DNA binding protein